ncbi:MAG: hypothetical protein U5J83_12685 [Bryobacterales bacterium]|nr:hypothetical protein [Bryobacterales bacterium]
MRTLGVPDPHPSSITWPSTSGDFLFMNVDLSPGRFQFEDEVVVLVMKL